jgi:hypothetical protein
VTYRAAKRYQRVTRLQPKVDFDVDDDGKYLVKLIPRRSKSLIFDCGVRVELTKKGKEEHIFFCLVGNCVGENGEGCKVHIYHNSTKQACRHLKSKHGITSNITKAREANAATGRLMAVRLSLWAAEHSIPYEAFKSDSWNAIARSMPVSNPEVLVELDVPMYLREIARSNEDGDSSDVNGAEGAWRG